MDASLEHCYNYFRPSPPFPATLLSEFSVLCYPAHGDGTILSASKYFRYYLLRQGLLFDCGDHSIFNLVYMPENLEAGFG